MQMGKTSIRAIEKLNINSFLLYMILELLIFYNSFFNTTESF